MAVMLLRLNQSIIDIDHTSVYIATAGRTLWVEWLAESAGPFHRESDPCGELLICWGRLRLAYAAAPRQRHAAWADSAEAWSGRQFGAEAQTLLEHPPQRDMPRKSGDDPAAGHDLDADLERPFHHGRRPSRSAADRATAS